VVVSKKGGRAWCRGRDTDMLWSLALGAAFVVVLAGGLYPLMWGTVSGQFYMVSEYSEVYHGKIYLNKPGLMNVTEVVPHLKAYHRNYTYREVSEIAKALGMPYPVVFERGNYYIVSSGNATLMVEKNGEQVTYFVHTEPTGNTTMSDSAVEKVAEEYLKNLKIALPWGVELVPHVVVGGVPVPGHSNLYRTKIVKYYAYFQNYRVGLKVTIEIDSKGKIYRFNSTPLIVEPSGYIRISSFTAAYRWLENTGIPVPVRNTSVRSVVVEDVEMGYVLYGGDTLLPGYILHTRVFYDVDNYVDYEVSVLWSAK